MRSHAVDFRDADFPHRSAVVWSKLEGAHRRWIPYGMPRLSPALSQSVFFLFGRNPKTGVIQGPYGSGVIVAARRPEELTTNFYAVTAAHVVKAGVSIIVLNTRDGASRPIDLDCMDWSYDLTVEDIAAVDITDRLRKEHDGDEFAHIPVELLATPDFITYAQINVGEDGFMLGLFEKHSGKDRNLIAARFGNISLMANDDVPIERETSPGSGDWVTSPCHLFDIHSRPGFSGSPVFIYRTPDSDLRDAQFSFNDKRREFRASVSDLESKIRHSQGRGNIIFDLVETIDYASKFLSLLGVHVAEYYDEVQITDAPIKPNAQKMQSVPVAVRDGDTLQVPGSMTIVVPAWKIVDLLHRDKRLMEQRKVRNERDQASDLARKRRTIVGQSAKVPAEPADANPAHKEDFTALLGEAVQSPAKGG